MPVNIPRIILAGTNSGCGKTTITAGILAALVKRGLKVQPYKVGPDYIDPMFHTHITGRSSRNLDSWMLQADVLETLFCRNAEGADLAVIEGVMGLHDGFGNREEGGSTAHVARITRSPVVLVVNPEGMALSTAALIKGFAEFDREVEIRAVIFNRIYGPDHYRLLKDLVEESTGIRVAGYLENAEEVNLESRHLGLVTAGEVAGLDEKIEQLRLRLEKTVELDLLLKLAREAEPMSRFVSWPGFPEHPVPFSSTGTEPRIRLAVARDKAFCFYYQDNLDLLEEMGAELIPFSPVRDSSLPASIDGLLLGGGYPEVWAGELEENVAMRLSIRGRLAQGLPCYAECGGLLYLCNTLQCQEGRTYSMTGVLGGCGVMTSHLQRFGYVEVEITEDNLLANAGEEIRGHEFHCSRVMVEPDVRPSYRVLRRKSGKTQGQWTCGYRRDNMLAGYAHLHFWSNPRFASRLVSNLRQWKASRKKEGDGI